MIFTFHQSSAQNRDSQSKAKAKWLTLKILYRTITYLAILMRMEGSLTKKIRKSIPLEISMC
jgi:hypothetical protein